MEMFHFSNKYLKCQIMKSISYLIKNFKDLRCVVINLRTWKVMLAAIWHLVHNYKRLSSFKPCECKMSKNKVHPISIIGRNVIERNEGRQEHNPSSEWNILYYVTTMSGPILACVCGSFLTLLPIHSVFEHPNYWYEDSLCRILAAGIVFTCQQLIRADYWSNFTFENKLTTYLLMIGLTFGLHIAINAVYYSIWTTYLGLFQPMPLGHFLVGSIIAVVVNGSFWFR